MADSPEVVELERAITGAVEGTLVTKWTVLAEVIDDQGETSFQSIVSDSMSLWDQLGFLAFQTRFKEQMVERASDD